MLILSPILFVWSLFHLRVLNGYFALFVLALFFVSLRLDSSASDIVITGRSSQLSPSGNLPLFSFPFPSLFLSLSFLPFPHHHRHHCQRPTAAAAFHLWLLVPPVAAGERRQQQWVIGSGGGGDLEREGQRKKEGGEREREGGCRAEGTVSGHALGMALTVVMSGKRRKKRGIERNREKRERGEIAGRRELRRRGDSRFWRSGRGGWVILEKSLELLFDCMKG